MNENSGHPAGHLKQLHVSFHFLFSLLQLKRENSDILEVSIGEGNGNPLQYSCLENPIDGGAW